MGINGTDNHVHILLKLHPTIALSVLLKELKSYSSGWMKSIGHTNFGWQDGYGAFSYSISQIEPVLNYIKNQKNHHKVHSFDDELKSLAQQWNVSWDEKVSFQSP